jgi:hypothetical protein
MQDLENQLEALEQIKKKLQEMRTQPPGKKPVVEVEVEASKDEPDAPDEPEESDEEGSGAPPSDGADDKGDAEPSLLQMALKAARRNLKKE